MIEGLKKWVVVALCVLVPGMGQAAGLSTWR
jgi:hypothetical protein